MDSDKTWLENQDAGPKNSGALPCPLLQITIAFFTKALGFLLGHVWDCILDYRIADNQVNWAPHHDPSAPLLY